MPRAQSLRFLRRQRQTLAVDCDLGLILAVRGARLRILTSKRAPSQPHDRQFDVSGKIDGTLASATEAGDMLTDITAEQLADAPRDERVAVSCGGHQTIGIHTVDHSQPEMTFLAIVDDQQLRLTIVGENARAMLGLNVGDAVVVQWQ